MADGPRRDFQPAQPGGPPGVVAFGTKGMRLLPNGAMELLPASAYDRYSTRERQIWGHRFGRYVFPTIELIDWLNEQIGDRSVIEIGSGSGDLCYHLGIRGTDNYQQTMPDVVAYYAVLGQPTISYGPWVERIEALAAVRKYKPDVVIGSWITHWIDPNKPFPPGGGNMYGVKEDELLSLVNTYMMIGNAIVHRNKPILYDPSNFDLEVLKFDFLKSRASNPDEDRIFVWRRR